MECSASTIPGSILLRDCWAFFIHRGGTFARYFKNPRAAEPELDAKSLAFLGIPTPPNAARRPSSGRFYLRCLKLNLLLLHPPFAENLRANLHTRSTRSIQRSRAQDGMQALSE